MNDFDMLASEEQMAQMAREYAQMETQKGENVPLPVFLVPLAERLSECKCEMSARLETLPSARIGRVYDRTMTERILKLCRKISNLASALVDKQYKCPVKKYDNAAAGASARICELESECLSLVYDIGENSRCEATERLLSAELVCASLLALL